MDTNKVAQTALFEYNNALTNSATGVVQRWGCSCVCATVLNITQLKQ